MSARPRPVAAPRAGPRPGGGRTRPGAVLSRDGSPNGYHALSVDGAACTTRLVPADGPDRAVRITLDRQFHARDPEVARARTPEGLLGSPIPAEAVASTDLVVDVFDGGPRTRVSADLGGGRAPVALERVRWPDRFVAQVHARDAGTEKPRVSAIPSSHVWSARLPADLGAGTHRADVTVTDAYGRTRRGALVIEVVGA